MNGTNNIIGKCGGMARRSEYLFLRVEKRPGMIGAMRGEKGKIVLQKLDGQNKEVEVRTVENDPDEVARLIKGGMSVKDSGGMTALVAREANKKETIPLEE